MAHKSDSVLILKTFKLLPRSIPNLELVGEFQHSSSDWFLNKNANARTSHCMQKGGLEAG